MRIIIVSPSLNPAKNVSGISSVTNFIIENNPCHHYIHFELGRKDEEKGGIFRIRSIIRKYLEWKKLLRKYPDAIVHYNFPLEKPSILRDTPFMRAALRNGNRMVIHIHGGIFLTSEKIPFPFRQILRHVFSWKVPFITLSEKETDCLRDRFRARQVVTLPNCIDTSGAEGFERWYKNESQPLTLGYLGRIAPTKGMDYLLQACKILKERDIPFTLKLAGAEETAGQYLPLFSNLLEGRFAYSGIVSGEEKRSFLKSIDILVMPTFFEGLPISLLECMSYGAVPVITPVGSIATIVSDYQNGLFIKVRDTESIVEAIMYLNSHRDRLKQMSMASRECILGNYNPESYIRTLNGIYQTL